MIICKECHHHNSDELVYCENENCIAVLYEGVLLCDKCQYDNPVNAVYCVSCGHKLYELVGGIQCKSVMSPRATTLTACVRNLSRKASTLPTLLRKR